MPERALFRALEAWLPEFRLFVDADGKRPAPDADDEVKSESCQLLLCRNCFFVVTAVITAVIHTTNNYQ